MVVHESLAWILLAVCSLAGAIYIIHTQRSDDHEDQRSGLRRIARYVDLAMLGVGLGMGVAFITLLAAAVLVHVGF